MRSLLLLGFFSAALAGCNKDKYQTEPQIEFETITEAFPRDAGVEPRFGPKLTIVITDAEGDVGTKVGDTAWVFVKNLSIAPFEQDSFPLPESPAFRTKKDFKGEAEIALAGSGLAGSNGVLATDNISGKNDTLFFEVYVKDRADHKSNVVKTPDPLIYLAP